MTWIDETLDELARSAKGGAIGYSADAAAAAEPTAIAALALIVHGRIEAAQKAAGGLVAMQQPNGEVAVRSGEQGPGWPSSLAVVAWSVIERTRFQKNIDAAVAWLLANRGQPIPRSADFGHNTELVGWAYAENTHSWVEPTAFGVLALKAVGQGEHAAAREGVKVLIDRQLPGGGLNYGNTYVLGQLIRPHVEPTGIGLLALGGEPENSGRVAKSIAWLQGSIGPQTTPLSLGWALLGLRAQGAEMPQASDWLAAAASKSGSLHKRALLALAVNGWPI